MAAKAKKSFELRMSKKVAELTQVVHMLFTRNHEREVESQLTKDLYNQELDRLHNKYQQEMKNRDDKIKELTELSKTTKSEEEIKTRVEEVLQRNDAQWTARYESLESEHLKMKADYLCLCDALKKTQEELTIAKSSMNDSSATFKNHISTKDSEINRLQSKIKYLEQKLSDEVSKYSEQLETTKKLLEHQEDVNKQLRSVLDNLQTDNDELSKKRSKLEAEVTALKRELFRKNSEVSDIRKSVNEKLSQQSSQLPPSQDVYDELENLRRLVQKYRLELSNREGNFNRMFTEKNPVHVDPHNIKTFSRLSARPRSKENGFSYNLCQTSLDNREPDKQLTVLKTDGDLNSRKLTAVRRPMNGRQLLAQYSQNNLNL